MYIFAVLKNIKMVNRYILDELMKIPSNNSTSLMKSLHILKGFKIDIGANDKYDVLYRVKLDDILNSSLDNSALFELRNGGWEYDEKQEYLIKNMNEK